MRSTTSAIQFHAPSWYTYRQKQTHDTQAQEAGTHLRHSAVVKLEGLTKPARAGVDSYLLLKTQTTDQEAPAQNQKQIGKDRAEQ